MRWVLLGQAGGGKVDRVAHSPAQCFENAFAARKKEEGADPAADKALPLGALWCGLGLAGGGTVDDKSYTAVECLMKSEAPEAWIWLSEVPGVVVDKVAYTQAQCLKKAVQKGVAQAFLHVKGLKSATVIDGVFYTPERSLAKLVALAKTQVEMLRFVGCAGGGAVGGKMASPKECFAMATAVGVGNPAAAADAWAHLAAAGGGPVDGVEKTPAACLERCLSICPTYVLQLGVMGKLGGHLGGRLYTRSQADALRKGLAPHVDVEPPKW